ncbi:hypothetical protein [Streptomyces uncialis]|nr:hypothetical protein [Streptomyces uncialis]MCX4658669.1 hypothetical protein [Streptomyces uncialis]WST66935.1 hypothetical protein OG268_04995 [Streptomyces uncialis]WTE14447.1 hypothetical protein OG924_32005 [Streptomyces uncialis]
MTGKHRNALAAVADTAPLLAMDPPPRSFRGHQTRPRRSRTRLETNTR